MRILKKLFAIGLVISATWFVAACEDDSKSGKSSPPKVATGSISGVVNDAATNTPLDKVHVVARDASGKEVAAVDTDAAGKYKIVLQADLRYSLTLTVATHHTEIYSNILVLADEENILETVLEINIIIVGTGTISGTVLDAITGRPVTGALLSFRKGINAQAGDVVGTATTDSSGNYSITTLETGSYTAEIALAGYTIIYATRLVLGGQTLANQNSTVSPILADGETRIVLNWGQTPDDLDSHLTGPNADNSLTRFHVFFGSEVDNVDEAGNVDTTKATLVSLDVDDTDSFGPETITIKSQFQGTYRYLVHDYSSESLARTPDSVILANSGAKATVYQGKAEPRVFNVPSGVGVVWTVFELNGTAINPINTMSDVTPEVDSSVPPAL